MTVACQRIMTSALQSTYFGSTVNLCFAVISPTGHVLPQYENMSNSSILFYLTPTKTLATIVKALGVSSCLSPVATVMGSVGSVVSRCDLIVIITTQRQFIIYTVHCIMQHDPSSSYCYVIRPLSKGLTHQHCHRMYITFTQLVRPPLLFILFLSSFFSISSISYSCISLYFVHLGLSQS